MTGFRSIQHQGHARTRAELALGRELDNGAIERITDWHNPYPKGLSAFYEYQDGCNAARRGDVIDIRGLISSPGVNTVKHASVQRQGTGW